MNRVYDKQKKKTILYSRSSQLYLVVYFVFHKHAKSEVKLSNSCFVHLLPRIKFVVTDGPCATASD